MLDDIDKWLHTHVLWSVMTCGATRSFQISLPLFNVKCFVNVGRKPCLNIVKQSKVVFLGLQIAKTDIL